MRAEIIRCDTCGKEHGAEYALTHKWIVTTKISRYNYDNDANEENHFCSAGCIRRWIVEHLEDCACEPELPRANLDYVDECMEALHTTINFIHVNENLTGPAYVTSQRMIVRNVRENFKKLSDAILLLRKKEGK